MESDRFVHRGITIYRHGRRWRFTWRAENRWVVRDSLPEAVEEVDRLLAARERKRRMARIEGHTIGELVPHWWQRKQRELRESSQMRYEGVIRLHILPILGHLSADHLRPLDIEDFYARITIRPRSFRATSSGRPSAGGWLTSSFTV